MSDDIPNPYLAALRQARGDAGPVAEGIRDELKPVKTAMDSGAWVSTAADDFYEALTGQTTQLAARADARVRRLRLHRPLGPHLSRPHAERRNRSPISRR